MEDRAGENDFGGAAGSLRAAEDGASAGAVAADGGVAGANEAETRGFYRGTGRQQGDGDKKKKAKGFLKGKGPMGLILGLILGVGGVMGGAQTLMPMAIEELIIEKFNSIGISSTIASDAWLNTQLNNGVRLEHTTTGELMNLFAFSENQVNAFERQGIKVLNATESGSGIGGTRVTRIMALLYKKGDVWIPVVGSDMLKYNDYTESDLINAIKYASGLENIGTPISASDALNDMSFKTPYTTASKGWRGGISGWFDSIMTSVTETKLSINRNRWTRWATGLIEDATKAFKETASGTALSKSGDDGLNSVEGDPVYNDENEFEGYSNEQQIDQVEIDKTDATAEQLERIRAENGNDDVVNTTDTAVSGSSSISNVSKVLNSKAVKAASAIADYGCAVLAGVVSIYTVVSAYENMQFLNLISGYLEAVDKVKAGDGDESPIHQYSTNLTTPGDTKDDEGNVVATDKSAMASAGMAWLFSGDRISQNDASVRNVNFETVMSNTSGLFSDVTSLAKLYETCGYVKAATATVDLATTIISFIPIFGQGVKAVQIGVKEVAKVAVKAAVQIALYAVIPIAAKNLSKMMIENAATEWFGEDLGNAIISGASKYLGGNATSGLQSAGSREMVAAYYNEYYDVIAEEAKYQRSIRSPFDVTSKYTFLGSLAYSMIPFAYSNSLMSTVAKISSLAGSSLSAVLPTAKAISEQDELASEGECGLLESVGAVGDAFCNPYIVTDVSTIRESPVVVSSIVHRIGEDNTVAASGSWVGVSDSNFNADGSIKKDSNLAKYIVYCGQRTSQYGIMDAAIAEKINIGGGTVSKIINYVPVLGNIQSIAEGISEEVNMSWTNGSACIASSENSHWDEYKWYQRYAENERLLENMDPDYKSPVTKLAVEYYNENPVDNSLEGQLARFSGMSKDDVLDTLALILYYEYLDEYDIAARYAFGAPAVEVENEILFDDENAVAEVYVVLLNEISFADIRNRTALV